MGTVASKLLVIGLVAFGIYLLMGSNSVFHFPEAFHGSHLEEVALGFLVGLVTIFCLK